MVTAMDEAVGGIIQNLKQKNLFDRTVFIFTSDNGGFTNGGGRNKPYRGQKRTNWQGGVKVPAFISGPNIRRASFYDDLIHIIDIQPTILGTTCVSVIEIDPQVQK